MAGQQFPILLGLAVLTVFVERVDSDMRRATARNRRLALFRNDICYINRFSSAPPVFEAAAPCQVASDQGSSMAYQQFEQELQRNLALKATAEEELQHISQPRQSQLRNDLRYLNRVNQSDNPNLPPSEGQDGW